MKGVTGKALPPKVEKNWSSKSEARFMALSAVPATDVAQAVINATLVAITDRFPAKRNVHIKSAQKHSDAVAAILYDLLKAAATDLQRRSYRLIRPAAFKGQHVSYRFFTEVIDAMEEAKLVQRQVGGFSRSGGFDADPDGDFIGFIKSSDKALGSGIATRFVGTSNLLKLAEVNGLSIPDIDKHFRHRPPTHVLELKRSKHNIGSSPDSGPQIPIVANDRTRQIEHDVRQLNDFLGRFHFEGCQRLGYYRVFNCGDRKDFRWNLGGRLFDHARKESYQFLPERERLRIKIDGAAVAEVDIRGSFLTIFYGLMKHEPPWEDDPYEVDNDDLPRDIVKHWMTITLGHNKYHERWPTGTAKRLDISPKAFSRKYPIRKVQDAVLKKHPVLRKYHRVSSVFDLMFVESEIILGAMKELMNSNIPSLTVHDSLIVRQGDSDDAIASLFRAFVKHARVTPHLKVSFANGRTKVIKPSDRGDYDAAHF